MIMGAMLVSSTTEKVVSAEPFAEVTLIVYGLVLNFTSGNKLFNPLDKSNGEGSTVTISTNDGSEVVPGNTTKGNGGSLGGNSSNVIGNNGSGGSLGGQVTEGINTNPKPSGGNSGGSTYTPPAQTQQPQQQVQPTYPTLEETNNSFRQTNCPCMSPIT